jgi:hypothetical protein
LQKRKLEQRKEKMKGKILGKRRSSQPTLLERGSGIKSIGLRSKSLKRTPNQQTHFAKPPAKKRMEKKNWKEKDKDNERAKTSSRNIIREVKGTDWDQDGYTGEGPNKKKTYKCKLCQTGRIRSNNRRVHACKS